MIEENIISSEFEKLINCFKEQILGDEIRGRKINIKEPNYYNGIRIYCKRTFLTIQYYPNSERMEGQTFIVICLGKGEFDKDGMKVSLNQDDGRLDYIRLKLVNNNEKQYGWVDIETGGNFKKCDELVNYWLGKFFIEIRKATY